MHYVARCISCHTHYFSGTWKIDFTTARWDFRLSPQSPPRISGFRWTFELQVGASSRASSWQQGALRCGKKVGWLLCFAMFFLPNYLVGNSRPVLLSSVTPPPRLSKPHAPRPTPCSPHGLNTTTRKRSRAINHASG